MRTIKYISVLSCLIIFCFLSVSCTSNSEEVFHPDNPQRGYDITLSFSYATEWSIKNSGKDNQEINSFIEDKLKSGIARHKIFIYEASRVSSGSQPVASFEHENFLNGNSYDFSLPINLPEGDYVVKAWTDFRPSLESEPYFNLTNFPQVLLKSHSGLTSYQDSFSGSQSFHVSEASSTFEILMYRPSGRYILINDDFQKFLDEFDLQNDDVTIIIAYSGFYPDTYSVITDRLTDSITGEYYKIIPVLLSDGSALVATDFMLMNSGGSSVTLQLRAVNKKGETVASSEMMSVPLNRNEIIINNGIYLSTPSEGGGFDMDPGFDGDINITT